MKSLRVFMTSLLVTLLALTFTAGTGTAVPIPGGGAKPTNTDFQLDGQVIDGGQQIVSVTVEASRYRVNPKSLSVNTFQVHAKGTNPYASLDPATVFGTYDQFRTVTGVKLNRHGDIVISLLSGEDAPAAFTFGWANSVGRNVMLDLTYTITQRLPVRTAHGSLRFTGFTQGEVVDREVDAFRSAVAGNGIKYRIYKPSDARRGKSRPLIVWLHGGGEGGWDQAYDNDLPLIANRGALGFTTASAQRIFQGAYVVAPQATDYWLNDAARGYAAKLKALIDEVVASNNVDRRRILVVGASNGGFMTMKLAATYPTTFAAAVPICGVRTYNGTVVITDAELDAMRSTPSWFVAATSDTTVPFDANTGYAVDRIGNALLSAYPDVVWNGHTFNSHWSWIYVAHNDPALRGTHLYRWLAGQRRG